MAEETTAQQTADETQANKSEQTETDWQAKYEAMRAHSREWEKKAKENAAAATELEQLKEAQLSEQEKATARAEKAEAELASMKAHAELMEAARDVSTKTGVPLELLELMPNQEAMDKAASIWAQAQPAHSAPRVLHTNVNKGSEQTSTADLFAAAINNQ